MATEKDEYEEFEEEDDDDEERRQFQRRSRSAKKSKTPVWDNFSEDLETVISREDIQYYIREKEANQIALVLLKRDIKHLAMIGEDGVGKDTLLKVVISKIKRDRIDTDRHKFKILQLEDLVAGTKYRGQLEERIKALTNEIEKDSQENYIIYLKNIDVFFKTNANETSVQYLLNRWFKIPNVKIVVCMNADAAAGFFSYNQYAKSFNTINIAPPNKAQLREILKIRIPVFEKKYAVKINGDLIVDDIIDYSNLYFMESPQPTRAINLLDDVCTAIEYDRYNLREDPNLGILADEDEQFIELKTERNKLIATLEDIKKEKNEHVKKQDFEAASASRDQEKRIVEQIEENEEAIKKASINSRVNITLEHLILVVSYLTGFEIDKIRNKEAVTVKLKLSSNAIQSLPNFEKLQTQSILHGDNINIKTGLAFVLIPHNAEFDEIFYHYIKPALEHHGLNVLKADNIYEPGNILSQVWAQIRSAEVIIADVSDKNPNVIFELGLCYGIQRCPIILTRNPEDLPFNIRNLRYINYTDTAAGLHNLSTELKKTVAEFLSATRNHE